MIDSLLSGHLIAWSILAIVALAAYAHGLIGVGFPLITTPCIALLTDLKTAVLITVLPNILLNALAILRGGNWRESLYRHWPIAVYVLFGSIIGTQFLIGFPPDPLKLLLAAMMLVSINMKRIKLLDFGRIFRYPRLSEAFFGLLGGIMSGVVNVSVPALAIYFMGISLSPTAMVQLFNLCFIVGKVTQAGTLAAHGAFDAASLWDGLLLSVIAVPCQLLAMRIHAGTDAATYRRWMNMTLLFMAILLLLQVLKSWIFG